MSQRVDDHIRGFNAAVESGDFTAFAARFSHEAVMRFVGPPVGPFHGREAIAAGYAAQPPTDTITSASVRTDADTDVVEVRWRDGGAGTMTLRWRDGQVADLTVAFG